MTKLLPPANLHPQVMTSRGVAVDEGLVELLEWLWAQGYDTQYSCQGGSQPMTDRAIAGVAMPSVFFGEQCSDASIIFAELDAAVALLKALVPGKDWRPSSYYDIPTTENVMLRALADGRGELIWRADLTAALFASWQAALS